MAATRAATGSNVKEIKDDSQFKRELTMALEKLVVVDFFATWCGPCKDIAPKVDELSIKYPQAVFLKVDVDVCINTKRLYEIKSMPTFVFFHRNKKLQSVLGADAVALEAGIVKHLGNIPTDGSSAGGQSSVSVPGQENLNSLVNMANSECLNESDNHEFGNALSPGSSCLESDCDEQINGSSSSLNSNPAFQQPVKIHSMQFIAPQDGRAPKTVKLFINQVYTMDFDTAEGMKPVQELVLTADDVNEESVVPLSYIKFQNVQQLTIFIKDNQGDCETTAIQYIGIFGGLLDSTDMKDFKRVAGDKGERH